jgi:hypothetical protein
MTLSEPELQDLWDRGVVVDHTHTVLPATPGLMYPGPVADNCLPLPPIDDTTLPEGKEFIIHVDHKKQAILCIHMPGTTPIVGQDELRKHVEEYVKIFPHNPRPGLQSFMQYDKETGVLKGVTKRGTLPKTLPLILGKLLHEA